MQISLTPYLLQISEQLGDETSTTFDRASDGRFPAKENSHFGEAYVLEVKSVNNCMIGQTVAKKGH